MAHQLLPPPPLAAAAQPKLKLLYSFGGQILHRPSDGTLRYAGGHTRLISLPRSITFPDLILRLTDACASIVPIILKYQLPGEDLDALVSVSCAEDLANMVDEFDRIAESHTVSPKLRAFLFIPGEDPDNTIAVQSYLEAVNGISRSSSGSAAEESAVEGTSPVSVPWPEKPPSTTPYVVPTQNPPTGYQPEMVVGVSTLINQVPFVPSQPHLPLAVTAAAAAADTNRIGLKNCFMCEKALPHAHSDTVVQQQGIEFPLVATDFHTFHSEVTAKKAVAPMVTVAPGKNWVKAVAPVVSVPPVTGVAMGVPVNNWPVVEKIGNCDVAGVVLPKLMQEEVKPWQNVVSRRHPVNQETITNPFSIDAGVVLPRSSFLNLPQHYLGHLQQEKRIQSVDAPRYPVKKEMITNPFSGDARVAMPSCSMGLLSNQQRQHPGSFGQWEQQCQNVGSLQFHDNANFARIGHLQVSQTPECLYSYINNSPQAVTNSGIVIEENYRKPIVRLPPTSMYDPPIRDLGHAGIGQKYHGPYPPNLGVSNVLPSLNGWGLGMHGGGTDLVRNDRIINTALNGDWKGEVFRICDNHLPDQSPASQDGNVMFPLSNTTSPTETVNTLEESVSSDSLFSNEDPWKVLGGAYLPPPMPRWVAKNNLAISEDSSPTANHKGNRTDSTILSLLEEGTLRHSKDHLNKALNPEPLQPSKEEKVVGEPVAAPVLESFEPPGTIFEQDLDVDKENDTIDDNTELHMALPKFDKIEDEKLLPMDDIYSLLHIREGIERLQLIKNSDLEELRELGSGTFGTVYHGKWRGSDVAIKRISNRCFAGKASEEERMRTDFWNEACQLANLHHPNVVAFFGVVLDGPGGSVATVTEYMVNGSLRTALQGKNKTLDWRKRHIIAMDVAFGMEYLHGKNIVHFDLKSDNLLVNLRDPRRPICKVGDLGLSKVKCRTLISGGVRGTLPWMAPELLDGSRNLVSEKVDVFSYGIVMWELLTGEEPYADMYYGAIIGGIVSNTLRPPVPENCEIQWRLLMEQCWSSEPSDRPSFTEVVDALRSMSASLPRK